MIRYTFLEEINQALSEGPLFVNTDFEIINSDKQNNHSFIVRYRFEPQFEFAVTVDTNSPPLFRVVMRPGELVDSEVATYNDRRSLLVSIRNWVIRVQSELKTLPLQRQIDQQKQKLDEFIKEAYKQPNEYFTRDEADDLKKKVDELGQKLEANIKASVEDQAEAQKKINALKRDVETLKEQTELLRKPGWIGAFGVRFFKWIQDPTNQKVLQAGAEAAAKLMLPSGHDPNHPH